MNDEEEKTRIGPSTSRRRIDCAVKRDRGQRDPGDRSPCRDGLAAIHARKDS
jgi:hypothetical protein